jgi:hypothetical protein
MTKQQGLMSHGTVAKTKTQRKLSADIMADASALRRDKHDESVIRSSMVLYSMPMSAKSDDPYPEQKGANQNEASGPLGATIAMQNAIS